MLSPKSLVSIHLPVKRTQAIGPVRETQSFKVIPPGGVAGNNRLSKEVPMKKQAGFTLIELTMVIVILGVLAVTALPKYIDMKKDAQQAALNAMAGSLSAASAINYAAKKAGNTSAVAIANCSTVSTLLQVTMPTNYTITAAAVAADATVSCVLKDSNNNTLTDANFSAIGT
jgi:MSHA pilin protein MshA